MKKLAILGMSAAMLLSACADGSQNTSNTIRNSSSNAPMNSNMTTNMNSNSMNSNMMSNVNSNSTAVVQDNFWTTAAQGGMAEVELGKLAASKATNAEVKQFAQMMVTDHTKANTELKTLAAKKSVTLPTEVSSSHKSLMEDLNKKTGADFDKAYVDAMVDDHEEDVEFFKDKSEDSSDADVKAFAAKTLPTLQKHLETIKGIQAKMK